MDAVGGNQINLTNNSTFDGEPSWSPDGSKIAFSRVTDGIRDIYVMGADGSNLTRLTFSSGHDSYSHWGRPQ